MSTLIIDAAKDKVFFMVIDNHNIYNITHENSKNNYVFTRIQNIDGIDYLVENDTNYVFTFDMNNPKFLGLHYNNTIIPHEKLKN